MNTTPEPAADDFYDRALARMTRFALAVACLGALVAFAMRGSRAAGGFFVGAAISTLSLESWKMFARGMHGSSSKAGAGLAFLIASRYLIAGAVIYAIVRVSGISLAAVFVGLFTSLAAVLLEFVYELAFRNH